MTGVLLSGGVAFVVALILGGPSVQFLKRYKFGKAISADLPDHSVWTTLVSSGGSQWLLFNPTTYVFSGTPAAALNSY